MEIRIVLDTNAIYTASSGYLVAYVNHDPRTPGDDNLQLRWFLPEMVRRTPLPDRPGGQ